MEKFLKPSRLDLDPRSKDAQRLWIHWKKTLDNFFSSFETVPGDDVKLSALVNFVSPELYGYIGDAATYAAAVQILKDLFVKPKNETFSRHCLLTRQQQEGESIEEYKHALDDLAKDCVFENVEAADYRNAYVRDSFICGIRSPDIRQRLLEENLDLANSFEKARAYEMAIKNSERIGSTSHVINALPVTIGPENKENQLPDAVTCAIVPNRGKAQPLGKQSGYNGSCYFCGFQIHPRESCPAKNASCYNCGNKGHYGRMCRKAKKTTPPLNQQQNFVSALPTTLSDSVVSAKVRGHHVNVLIDTGSSESYISLETVQKLKLEVNRDDRHKVKMASSMHESETLGSTCVDMCIGDHTYSKCRLKILTHLCCDVIVGHNLLNQHRRVAIHFGGSYPDLDVDNINNPRFSCSLTPMQIEPASLFEHLSPDIHPIRCNSRQYSKPDQEFISERVKELLSDGRIEPSSSPWRAQVLVTSNERHRKRMVVDYSRTINKFCELDGYPFPNIDDMANRVAQFSFYSTFDLKSAYHQVPIREEDKPYTAFEAAGRLYQFTCIPYGVSNGVSAFQRTIDHIIDANNLENTFAYVDNITVCAHSPEELETHVTSFLNTVEKYGMTLNEDKTVKSVQKVKILGYEISKGVIKPDPDRMAPLENLPLPENSASLKRALGLFSYYSRWIPKFSEKVRPLTNDPTFPLNTEASEAFADIKRSIMEACLVCPNENDLLVIETDASDRCLSASLNQNGRPVAFFSRTLGNHEKHHPSVEKEACAIVEAVRKWRHYLCGRRFLLLTDQQAVSFIFNPSKHGKIKNDKLLRWRIELSCYDFDIKFRPGKENAAADCLSRVTASMPSYDSLKEIHSALCHPGITRMTHLVRARNLPYSIDDIKKTVSNCNVCAKIKPNYYKPSNPPLVKATQPLERISIDFKGPIPSVTANKYILTVVDEYSRFPFAFPCKDLHTDTVKRCLTELFSLFGPPGYVHSDRGASFKSDSMKSFLVAHGIGSSFTTPYNPRGNGQCERYNGIIWQTVKLALASKGLDTSHWEIVLPDALHSIRSLLCTVTNETPHERFLSFTRRTPAGANLPTWLIEKGKALLRRHVRTSKYDPLVDEVEILQTNPCYARVSMPNGKERTVSLRDLAPMPRGNSANISELRVEDNQEATTDLPAPVNETVITHTPNPNVPLVTKHPVIQLTRCNQSSSIQGSSSCFAQSERPKRASKPVERLEYGKLGGD